MNFSAMRWTKPYADIDFELFSFQYYKIHRRLVITLFNFDVWHDFKGGDNDE